MRWRSGCKSAAAAESSPRALLPLGLGHGLAVAAASAGNATDPGVALLATALHSAGYLMVTAFVALLVYEKLGLELLRKAWFNLDLLWAISLIATGPIGVLV